jgi:drug/metabolite transporter (DMT)-like permease
VQARLRSDLSVNAAGLARYLYGLPVSVMLLVLYMMWRGAAWPGLTAMFLLWAIAAGFAQIIGTNLLLMAFQYRGFVAGTAYAKTEAIQGALLSLLLLGERLSLLSWTGIAIGVAGVLALSLGAQRPRLRDLVQPAALCGLGAGFAFTLTSIGVKLATQTISEGDLVLAVLIALVVVQAGQVVMQGGWLLMREPGGFGGLWRSRCISAQVGALASLGSACWFTGFALAPVALVRAVGQVEVIFTLGFSRLYLGERTTWREIAALLLVAIGVALALWGYIAP